MHASGACRPGPVDDHVDQCTQHLDVHDQHHEHQHDHIDIDIDDHVDQHDFDDEHHVDHHDHDHHGATARTDADRRRR